MDGLEVMNDNLTDPSSLILRQEDGTEILIEAQTADENFTKSRLNF